MSDSVADACGCHAHLADVPRAAVERAAAGLLTLKKGWYGEGKVAMALGGFDYRESLAAVAAVARTAGLVRRERRDHAGRASMSPVVFVDAERVAAAFPDVTPGPPLRVRPWAEERTP